MANRFHTATRPTVSESLVIGIRMGVVGYNSYHDGAIREWLSRMRMPTTPDMQQKLKYASQLAGPVRRTTDWDALRNLHQMTTQSS